MTQPKEKREQMEMKQLKNEDYYSTIEHEPVQQVFIIPAGCWCMVIALPAVLAEFSGSLLTHHL